MKSISENLIPVLNEMLYELSTETLQVCLVPSRVAECAADGGMIRVVTSQNPPWYKELCLSYPCTRYKSRSERKDHTKIKRQHILSVLDWLIRNRFSRSIYAADLLAIAQDRLELYERLERESLLIKETSVGYVAFNNQF